MAYVTAQVISNKPYYYLVQNVRLHDGWKKYKTYLGSSPPTPEEVQTAQERLTARISGSPIAKYRYLSVAQAQTLSHIRSAYRIKLGQFENFLGQLEKDFITRFTYHTNAIEGNKLDFDDTRTVIEHNVTPARQIALREIYEAKNMEEALKYSRGYTRDLNLRFILALHSVLMHHLGGKDAGKFRTKAVKMAGAHFVPPDPEDIPYEMNRFLTFYKFVKKKFHPVEVAGLVHLKFIEIHPFLDGNGRMGRLLLNHVLMRGGYPPLIIPLDDRMDYYAHQQASEERNYGQFITYIVEGLAKDYLRDDPRV